MRNSLIAIFASLLAGELALAAHMAVNAQPPPPVPVCSWTGFYGGGNIGYRWGDARNDLGGVGSVTIRCNTGWKGSGAI